MEQLFHMRQIFGCFFFLYLQSQQDVAVDGPPFKEMIFLEHISDVGSVSGKRRLTKADRSLFRRNQSGDQGQKRAFAAAAGTDDDEELAFIDSKGKVGQCQRLTGERMV